MFTTIYQRIIVLSTVLGSPTLALVFQGSQYYHQLVTNLTSQLHDDIGTIECENVCESLAKPHGLEANCTRTCVTLLTDFIHASCGKNKTRHGLVTISVSNTIQIQYFNATVRLPTLRVQPFIRYMEEASLIDKRFRFSASHSAPHGYFINSINGLSGHWSADTNSGTYWNIKVVPGIDFHIGLSSFYPRSGDHILFTYTHSP